MNQDELQNYILKEFREDFAEIKAHITKLNDEMGGIQLAMERIRGKVNIYALITPILTGILGILATYIITR